jgi:hypothetical protein
MTLDGVVILNPSTSVILSECEGSGVLFRVNSGSISRWAREESQDKLREGSGIQMAHYLKV